MQFIMHLIEIIIRLVEYRNIDLNHALNYASIITKQTK